MSGSLPSEGVYEDIAAIPVEEKDNSPGGSQDLMLEEEYDDAQELEQDPEDEGAEEGAPLSSVGVHLCALASLALFLLYRSYVQCSALTSAYI